MAYNSTSWTSDGLTKAGATSTTSQSLTTGTLTANTLTLSEGNLTIPATYKVYFDGGGDTYITESSADVLDFYAGGVNSLRVDNDQIIISTSQLHFTNDSGAEILMSGTSAANIYSQSSFGLLAGSGGSDAGHYLSFGSAGSNSQMILKNGDVGIGITAPDNKLHVKNADGNSKSVIKLEQLDTDEPFILFTGTTAADQTKSLSTDTDVGALEGHILVSINGADKWIAYYAQD